jgi:hypothetical protein
MELLPLDWGPPVGQPHVIRHGSTSGGESTGSDPAGTGRTGAARVATTPAAARVTRAVPARPAPSVPGPRGRNAAPATAGAAAAQRFVNVCVEVLNGFRPAAHLRPFAEPLGFSAIADQLVRRTVRVRMTRAPQTMTRIVRVRRFVVCEPRAGVAEVAVVLDDGRSSWAMAIRMEQHPRGWLCALVQVV